MKRLSPQVRETNALNDRSHDGHPVFKAYCFVFLAFVLVSASKAHATPGDGEFVAIPVIQGLHKQVVLNSGGQWPVTGPAHLREKVGTDGRSGGVELLATVAPECSEVTQAKAQGKCEKGEKEDPEKLAERHALISSVWFAILAGFAGFAIGGGFGK